MQTVPGLSNPVADVCGSSPEAIGNHKEECLEVGAYSPPPVQTVSGVSNPVPDVCVSSLEAIGNHMKNVLR